jgi:hypothetical protein
MKTQSWIGGKGEWEKGKREGQGRGNVTAMGGARQWQADHVKIQGQKKRAGRHGFKAMVSSETQLAPRSRPSETVLVLGQPLLRLSASSHSTAV